MNTYLRNGQKITIPLYVGKNDIASNGNIPSDVIHEILRHNTAGLGLSKNDVENITAFILGEPDISAGNLDYSKNDTLANIRNLEYVAVLSSGAELTYNFLLKVF